MFVKKKDNKRMNIAYKKMRMPCCTSRHTRQNMIRQNEKEVWIFVEKICTGPSKGIILDGG